MPPPLPPVAANTAAIPPVSFAMAAADLAPANNDSQRLTGACRGLLLDFNARRTTRHANLQREDKTMRAAKVTGLMAAAFTAIALGTAAAQAHEFDEEVKTVFEHAIPNIEGKRMVAQIVSYPPGGKSLPHRHAPSAFIYARVLSGAIRSQVGEEPVKSLPGRGKLARATRLAPQDQRECE